MADKSQFRGPLLKVERAKHHIIDLETMFSDFLLEGDTHSLIVDSDSGGAAVYPFVKKPLPEHVATILGDALHNLRASLDHLFIILTEINGEVPSKRTSFPIGTKTKVEAQFAPAKPKPSQAVINGIMSEVRPYDIPEGDGLITALHELDIADKHIVLIPVSATVEITDMVLKRPDGSIGGRYTGFQMQSRYDNLPPGFRPLPMFVEGYEIEQQSSPDLKIVFDQNQPLAGRDVLETLKAISVKVENTIRYLAAIA